MDTSDPATDGLLALLTGNGQLSGPDLTALGGLVQDWLDVVRDRDDLRIIARVRAWLADLREPTEHHQNMPGGKPAYQQNKPLFRALTTTGNLKRRANATVRRLFLTGRAVNEMVKARAKAAGVSIINGLKVTSHSLRAGPNTDMAEALVPLAERHQAGDWTPRLHPGRRRLQPPRRHDRRQQARPVRRRPPLRGIREGAPLLRAANM